MVEKLITSPRNVIDFAHYQQGRTVGTAQAISTRLCRHCGAALADGENEDECSSAFNTETLAQRSAVRKFYAE
jgi:protein-disulfide isomerase-like protein with CxxC motif